MFSQMTRHCPICFSCQLQTSVGRFQAAYKLAELVDVNLDRSFGFDSQLSHCFCCWTPLSSTTSTPPQLHHRDELQGGVLLGFTIWLSTRGGRPSDPKARTVLESKCSLRSVKSARPSRSLNLNASTSRVSSSRNILSGAEEHLRFGQKICGV